MNACTAVPLPAAPLDIGGYLRSLPPVTKASFIAALACALLATAAWQGQWLRAPHQSSSDERRSPAVQKTSRAPAADAGRAAARNRCDGCATVESIRHIDTEGNAPGHYELKLRLRDGSTHTSTSPGAARWQPGDRVLLIGGEPAKD